MDKLKCCKECTTRYLEKYAWETGTDVYAINYKLLHEEGVTYDTLPFLYKKLGLEPISREYSKRVIY